MGNTFDGVPMYSGEGNSDYMPGGSQDNTLWAKCDHDWRETPYDTQAENEVICIKCKCPGAVHRPSGEVYWPAT